MRAEIAKLSATLTWRMILVAGAALALDIGAPLQFLPWSYLGASPPPAERLDTTATRLPRCCELRVVSP